MKGRGHLAFPQLGPRIEACKQCVAKYHLVFDGFDYLDVSIHTAGFCEICGKFRPLMTVRNKQRNLAFAEKNEQWEARKILRRTGR